MGPLGPLRAPWAPKLSVRASALPQAGFCVQKLDFGGIPSSVTSLGRAPGGFLCSKIGGPPIGGPLGTLGPQGPTKQTGNKGETGPLGPPWAPWAPLGPSGSGSERLGYGRHVFSCIFFKKNIIFDPGSRQLWAGWHPGPP